MPRYVFISTSYADVHSARGFALLQWNKNAGVQFVGRHLLQPVDSENEAYIRQKIREQMDGTSVTVVLLGKDTADRQWIVDEIRMSQEKSRPNGVLGIVLKDGVFPDPSSPVGRALQEAGARVIPWDTSTFDDEIELAAQTAGRAAALREWASTAYGTNFGGGGGGGACARPEVGE